MSKIKDFYFGVQEMLRNGITEEEFMINYEHIRLVLDPGIVIWDAVNGRWKEDNPSITNILLDVYVSNPEKNCWAEPNSISDELRLFLTLKGEL